MRHRILDTVQKSLNGAVTRRRLSARLHLAELEERAVPATFTVTNLNDSGPGSLRQATIDANNNGEADEIVFAGTATSGTIGLTSGQMFLYGPTTLSGPGAGDLNIDCNNTGRAFHIEPGAGQRVNIAGLTFTEGNGSGTWGGAIYNSGGNLTIENCVLAGNAAPSGGGAIWSGNSGASLTIRNSTLSGNSTPQAGGAIALVGAASVTIETCSIFENTAGTGGGVWSSGCPVQIVNSTISGNSASARGGGLCVESAPTACLIDSSTIADNSSNGPGGGLFVTTCAALEISNSTLSGNSTQFGGGAAFVTDGTPLEIRNSTISGNSALGNGGALYVQGYSSSLTVRNSTIAENVSTSASGGGIVMVGGNHTIESSIVADNHVAPTAAPNSADVFHTGTLNSIRSLYKVTPGGAGINGTNQSNLIADPQLFPLADNGGPTKTHAIPSTSPAVDAGSNSLGLTTDQRGVGNARDENNLPDIGAVEWDTALVTNLGNSVPGGLAAAIQRANEVPDLTPVRFAPGLTGTILLGGADIPLSFPIDVVGPGTGVLTVSGGNLAPAPGSVVDVSMAGLTWSVPADRPFNYNLTTTGNLTLVCMNSSLTFNSNLTVAAGILTATANGYTYLGPATTVAAGAALTSYAGFVRAGGTFGGAGTVNGMLIIDSGATLSPGPGIATLTVNGSLAAGSGGMINLDLSGPSANQYDRLIVNDSVVLSGVNLKVDFTPSPGTVFTLIENDGSDFIYGFTGVPNRGILNANGVPYQVRYDAGTGNDLTLTANTAPVVNPAANTNLNLIPEDVAPAANSGTMVDDILATMGLYSDLAGILRPGMAVTGLDTNNGTWQFSLDSGANWADFGAMSPTSATVLVADGAGRTRVRFLPNANYLAPPSSRSAAGTGWTAARTVRPGSIRAPPADSARSVFRARRPSSPFSR